MREALGKVNKFGEHFTEAELYRLKGELLLQKARQQATGNGKQAEGKKVKRRKGEKGKARDGKSD